MAALDQLKARHGLKRFHLAGQSGGAHTVAALAQMRVDVGCAVMASGPLSFKSSVLARGAKIDPAAYDPMDHVDTMQHQKGERLIVMSDPDDRYVAFRAQREFVERVRAKNIPILHVTADSGTEEFHGLTHESQAMAIDCAKGMNDDALIAKYQNKPAPAATSPIGSR